MTADRLWEKVNEKTSAMFIDRLAERWEDEKNCENINDYKEVIEKEFGIKVHSMTKKPFGFKAICFESKELLTVQICFDRNEFYLKGKIEKY